MKKTSFLILALFSLALPAFGQINFNLTLSVGSLTGPGTTTMNTANDPLMLLVDVGSSNVLPTVTAGAINNGNSVGAGGGILLAELTYNDNALGGTDETFNTLSVTTPSSVQAGDHIVLEWFPTVNASTDPTTLTAGESYGVINPSGSSVSTDGGQPWVVPSGGAITLNYITSNDGGDEPNASGEALFTVAAAPEPATYALLLFALPFLVWSYRRQTGIGAVAVQGRL